MRKKIVILLVLICCVCLVGCTEAKKHDTVEIYGKSVSTFDNVKIETPNGYFYDKHEKSVIDDNTIAVTIYFSNKKDGEWEVDVN